MGWVSVRRLLLGAAPLLPSVALLLGCGASATEDTKAGDAASGEEQSEPSPTLPSRDEDLGADDSVMNPDGSVPNANSNSVTTDAPDTPLPASPPDSAQADEPLPANCLWHGYGIGLSGYNQCDYTHMSAHAIQVCLNHVSAQGDLVMRSVGGSCSAGPQEIQVRCCYDGPLPTEIDLSGYPGADVFDREVRTAAPVTTATLRAYADAECAIDAQSLGDWYVLYQGDTNLAQEMLYYCTPAARAPSGFTLATFEEEAAGPLDLDPQLLEAVADLSSARGMSQRGVHFSGTETDLEVTTHLHGVFPVSGGYTALAFWARSDVPDATLEVAHASEEPAELPWPSSNVALSSEWQLFEIPFNDMLQAAAETRPLSASTLTGSTLLRFSTSGAYDLWIDDISYICGGSACRD